MATVLEVEWEVQRAQLIAERDEARQALHDVEEAAAIALNRQIASAVELVRLELGAECEQVRQSLAENEEAAALALDRQIATAVERAREESTAESGTLREENAQLKIECDKARDRLGEVQEEHRGEIASLEHNAAETLQREIASATDSFDDERVQRAAEEGRLREENGRLKLECGQAREFLTQMQEEHRAEVSALRREAAAVVEPVNAECVRLRNELDQRADAAAQFELDRTRLKMECERLNQALAEAQSARPAEEPGRLAAAIRTEATRVESVLREISDLIEDPATELAQVMRKNAERTQLESYLKGLLFSLAGE
jgi:regulator of replication initiation timing